MFCKMTRPMFERDAMQGSMRSSSSLSAMVTFLSWANVGVKAVIANAVPSKHALRYRIVSLPWIAAGLPGEQLRFLIRISLPGEAAEKHGFRRRT
jgi:hypothetical protein